jgi:hypothetical protein
VASIGDEPQSYSLNCMARRYNAAGGMGVDGGRLLGLLLNALSVHSSTATKDFIIEQKVHECLSESVAQTCQLSQHGFQFHIDSSMPN